MAVSDLVFIDSTGYRYADYPTFLAYVQSSYRGIYGSDIYLGADSMDGQWTAILAQMLYDVATVGSSTYNSFSPASAQGVGLSRNVKINGLERDIPTHSTADVDVGGTAGTVITNGIAVDTLNQQWALPASVTIPFGGTVTVTATAVEEGAVVAAANTINGIFTPTLGWQTVNNGAAATPGAPVETDAALRIRQAESTANPSLTVLEGTYGSIANTVGVQYVQVWENFTNTNDGNSQVPHSILAVVDGGSVTDVAQAIQVHKTPGTDPWSGPTHSGHNQSQVVYDSRGMPITIGFFQPPLIATIGVQVSLTPGVGWTTDFETTIALQISTYINSLGIGTGSQFNGSVRVIPLYSLVYVPGYITSMYVINSVQIQVNAGGFSTSDIPISFITLPHTSPLPGVDVVFSV